MPLRFSVLASGSSGNASLIEVDGFGVLLDGGLGPRLLAARMAAVGAGWANVNAMLLTHTHGDHWNECTLAHVHKRRIPLYCHAEHHPALREASAAFADLRRDGLVRDYEPGRPLPLSPSLR